MSVLTIAEPLPYDGLLVRRRDRTAWVIALVASLASIASFAYFDHRGEILAYGDTISHMEIARRVVDSPTTGFGQLGGVWLPLPHLLMLPFIWSDRLYYSGLAGSLVSMASYVVTSVLLYKIIRNLTGSQWPAVAGTFIFMSNPNVLYMQSIPMTELLLFACMAGMVYYLQTWIQTDNYQALIKCAAAGFLGSLVRYEAWVLVAAMVVIIAVVAWCKGYTRSRSEGTLLTYVFVGGLGILLWLGWNQLIFGNAFNFQDGKYAKPSLWVSSTDQTAGHWGIALKTYWYAIVNNMSWLLVAVLVLGLIALLLRERLALHTLPALSLLVFFPFFVIALEKGQRPLHVTQVTGTLYNVRFGLLMVLPTAIFGGYLVHAVLTRWPARVRLGSMALMFGATVVLVLALAAPMSRILTLREPVRGQHSTVDTQGQAASYLRNNYHGGKILAQFFGNENVLFDARVPLKNNIYEGSYRVWGPSLSYPTAHHVAWVVMRRSSTDEVYTRLFRQPALTNYRLAYQNPDYLIYTD